MFQLYGTNTFDRSSSIELRIYNTYIYIRKFVLDSELLSDEKFESQIIPAKTLRISYMTVMYMRYLFPKV